MFMSAVPPEADINSRVWTDGAYGVVRLRDWVFYPNGQTIWGRAAIALPRVISDFNLFSDGKRVIDLNSEVSHRTLNLRMSEQKLHRA